MYKVSFLAIAVHNVDLPIPGLAPIKITWPSINPLDDDKIALKLTNCVFLQETTWGASLLTHFIFSFTFVLALPISVL